jgi:hypothetical protein
VNPRQQSAETKMMKRIIKMMMVAAACGLAADNALADLGDTFTTADQKYGRGQNDNLKHEMVYWNNGLRIQQTYNDLGVCVLVRFTRLDRKWINDNLSNYLDTQNLPPSALDPLLESGLINGHSWTTDMWPESEVTHDTTSYSWTNGKAHFQVIVGQFKDQDGWLFSRVYMVPEGVTINQADLKTAQSCANN